jgi:hypothetical protein
MMYNMRIVGTDNECINRELEKQFNNSLQSKIAHPRHGGLGFQNCASSSSDWHQQSTKTMFVPATKPIESLSTDQNQASKKDEKEDKTDKKRKSKS